MRILVVGITGMLGYSLFKDLSSCDNFQVYGTARSVQEKENFFISFNKTNIFENIDVHNIVDLEIVIKQLRLDIVINCIGLIKQNEKDNHSIESIYLNALFPHKLADICNKYSAKLIHFSTDCVFSGREGGYLEGHLPDSDNIYGRSKCLGEVLDNHLTLRTSIIGHELSSCVSLVDWFLAQNSKVLGYSNAIFSGLPTCFVSKVLIDYILPNNKLKGLYHLSVDPINKLELLRMIRNKYDHTIEIEEFDDFVTDRSLNSGMLTQDTGYIYPNWLELIDYMHNDFVVHYKPNKNYNLN